MSTSKKNDDGPELRDYWWIDKESKVISYLGKFINHHAADDEMFDTHKAVWKRDDFLLLTQDTLKTIQTPAGGTYKLFDVDNAPDSEILVKPLGGIDPEALKSWEPKDGQ